MIGTQIDHDGRSNIMGVHPIGCCTVSGAEEDHIGGNRQLGGKHQRRVHQIRMRNANMLTSMAGADHRECGCTHMGVTLQQTNEHATSVSGATNDGHGHDSPLPDARSGDE